MFRVGVTALAGAILLSACGRGGNQPSPPPQAQSISFAQAGPLYKFQGDAPYTNVASGGAGTGAITYSSDMPSVATVDPNTGTVTIVTTGNAQITAMKAGDAAYTSSKASYSLLIAPRTVAMSAWTGPSDTDISFAALPFALNFTRSSDLNCDPTKYTTCANGTQSQTAGTPVSDSVATLSQPAMYWLEHGPNVTSGIVVPETKYALQTDPGFVAFNGRLWVVSDPVANEVWSTADGANWRLETAKTGIPPRSTFKLLVFNNALWVIGGVTGSTYLNDVWTSTDGKTWTQVTSSAAFPARGFFAAAAFNGRLWVSGGYTGSTDLNDVWSSTDGATWTQAPAPATRGREQHELVAFGGRLWIIGGWSFGSALSDVWSSPDGATWTEATPTAAFGQRFAHRVVTDGTTMWLTAGFDGYQSAQRDVWSSADGKTWTLLTNTAEFKNRADHGAAFFNGALWVTGGADNQVWSSPTGEHWTKLTLSARVPGMSALATAAYQGKLWALGDELQLWATADGLSWTEAAHSLPGSTGGPSLLPLADRLILLGGWQVSGYLQYYRAVWQSMDGQSWAQVLSSVPFAPLNLDRAVVFNGKLWVFAGSAADASVPEVWSSPDGANWTKVAANTPYGPRTDYTVMVYNNQLWVIAGANTSGSLNDVWSSSDGASWKQITTTGLPARTYSPGVALPSGMCIYAGDLLNYDVNDAWCSSDGALWTQKSNNAPFGPMTLLNGTIFGIGNSTPLQEDTDLVWQSADGLIWRRGYQNTIRFP